MKRSKFSLSHYKLATMDMGKLYPIAVVDVIPGDTIQQATSALVRLQPMLAPVMHPIDVTIHHWFVPYRLLWDDFEDFITGGPRGTSVPVFPTITKNFIKGSLGDYFGLFGQQEVSALPFRAYQKIYNEFYRDQDLQDELPEISSSGADGVNYQLQKVSWRKDYFTTARPWTQKGTELSVPVDFSGRFSISDIALRAGSMYGSGNPPVIDWHDENIGAIKYSDNDAPVVGFENVNDYLEVKKHERLQTNNNASMGLLKVKSDNVGLSAIPGTGNRGISIPDLRLALSLQRYEEARARYGSRYIEYLRYLGIRSSDARLQLPEYLGGGKQTIQISEVLRTGGDNGALGSMAGHGIGAIRSNRYRRFFEEHGVIISLMYIMPKAMYIQGTNRMWLKRTKEDFFQRELQSIGMQPVYTRELKGTAPNDAIFGYQDRYDEYRREPSQVCGDFRDSLDFWHLGRKFENDPVLNADFITHEPDKRIFAEQTQNEFLLMINHSIQARRMLQKTAKTRIQ